MTRNTLAMALLVLVAAALLGLLAACEWWGNTALPAEPQPLATTAFHSGSDTNFYSITLDQDLTTGDDITVGDDLTITDDTTAGDDLNVTGDVKIGNGTPEVTLNGEDLYVEGTFEGDGAAYFDGAVDMDSTLDVAGSITAALDVEHLRLPTIDSATVITTTDGALWTVGASEVWYIDRVFCNVTTNFDCTGDDCTIEIGLTGGDIDGFLDLDDGELQAADAEIAGLTAGWQGFGSTDTRGAFFAAGAGVILANDTVDIKIEDNSDQSDPTAGAATCYIVYTRLQ